VTCKPARRRCRRARYFRMHKIGYFEGFASERGIIWCCADSRSLGDFLRHADRMDDDAQVF
jgi:transposase